MWLDPCNVQLAQLGFPVVRLLHSQQYALKVPFQWLDPQVALSAQPVKSVHKLILPVWHAHQGNIRFLGLHFAWIAQQVNNALLERLYHVLLENIAL